MNLKLVRGPSRLGATIGELLIDGVHECYTCEDEVRAEKIPGCTAIPAGRYKVMITFSPRFGCNMPLLVGVPGFEGIRIHPGNTPADTEGCILVGQTRGEASVGRSRAAYQALLGKLLMQDVWIEIVDFQGEAACSSA